MRRRETENTKKLVPMFEQMAEVSGAASGTQEKRGAIDFDFPETKMILDEQGRPVELKPYMRAKCGNEDDRGLYARGK